MSHPCRIPLLNSLKRDLQRPKAGQAVGVSNYGAWARSTQNRWKLKPPYVPFLGLPYGILKINHKNRNYLGEFKGFFGTKVILYEGSGPSGVGIRLHGLFCV